MDELKKKANPLYKELGSLEGLIEKLIKEQVTTSNLLGKQVVEAKRTNEYKRQQKNGDRKYRIHDVRMKKQSSIVSGISVSISLLALSISIAANGIQPLLNMLKVL
jgi:hypothetical protein